MEPIIFKPRLKFKPPLKFFKFGHCMNYLHWRGDCYIYKFLFLSDPQLSYNIFYPFKWTENGFQGKTCFYGWGGGAGRGKLLVKTFPTNSIFLYTYLYICLYPWFRCIHKLWWAREGIYLAGAAGNLDNKSYNCIILFPIRYKIIENLPKFKQICSNIVPARFLAGPDIKDWR